MLFYQTAVRIINFRMNLSISACQSRNNSNSEFKRSAVRAKSAAKESRQVDAMVSTINRLGHGGDGQAASDVGPGQAVQVPRRQAAA